MRAAGAWDIYTDPGCPRAIDPDIALTIVPAQMSLWSWVIAQACEIHMPNVDIAI